MNLPNTELRIDLSDAQQCMSLIAALPLTKTAYVHDTLSALLEAFKARPLAAPNLLQVLEMARPAVAFAQEEMAGRYAARPVVPGGPDEETLARVLRLWRLMAQAYADVAQLGGDNPEIQNRIALICHRCIHYAGKPILEYFRARQALPHGAWFDLHGYYSTAEEWEIAETPVIEPLNDYSKTQTCAQAFAATLLVDLGTPYSRSPREYAWLASWGQRFSIFTAVRPVDEQCDARAYALDLDQDRGLRPLEAMARGTHMRRLDTTRLSRELHDVVRQLKARKPPGELGLGEGAFEPAASKLLIALYRPWCLNSSPRRFQRHAGGGTAQLCYGFEALHYYVRGAEFVQPAHVRTYSRAEFNEIATFRHQVDPTEGLHVRAAQIQYTAESWSVEDQSVNGFRLVRRGPGERIEHGQLVGMRPPDGDVFLLCEVSWLMYAGDGRLSVGVHVLPGMPAAVAVRPTGPSVSRSEQYVRAFLLPEMPALKEPASLVLPRGWYQPARVLDLYLDRSVEVRLTEVLSQGSNFERVAYAALRTSP